MIGSSPHTWGILADRIGHRRGFRFIPTYVGHTVWRSGPAVDFPVHPHIRGAYKSIQNAHGLHAGSSPHTWGIHRHHQQINYCTRFIPTYVGHTGLTRRNQAGQRFIPTYVGHTTPTFSYRRKASGSSPHTWGIHHAERPEYSRCRFIPTYVGHTSIPL